MSGHSKWSQIKRQKSVADIQKGAVFARFSKEISLHVRMGGPDPAYNARLRSCLDRARDAGVTNEVINRALNTTHKKDQFVELLYEIAGFVSMLIELNTDNRNRTAADIREILGRYSLVLGGTGSVSWQFRRVSEVTVCPTDPELPDLALELDGMLDMHLCDDELVLVVEPSQADSVQSAIRELRPSISVQSQLVYIPDNYVSLSAEETSRLERLIGDLESYPDVLSIHHNAE